MWLCSSHTWSESLTYATKTSSRKFGFASQPDGFAARFGIPSLHVLVLVGTLDHSGQRRRHDPARLHPFRQPGDTLGIAQIRQSNRPA